jgi:hypothetical protein
LVKQRLPFARRWLAGAGEVEEVRAFCLVQTQRIRERVEDGFGGAAEVSAFEPVVVLDAEPGERRDLFAAQPRYAALAERPDPDVLRRDPCTPGGEEVADLGLDVHVGSVGRLSGRVGCPVSTRNRRVGHRHR